VVESHRKVVLLLHGEGVPLLSLQVKEKQEVRLQHLVREELVPRLPTQPRTVDVLGNDVVVEVVAHLLKFLLLGLLQKVYNVLECT